MNIDFCATEQGYSHASMKYAGISSVEVLCQPDFVSRSQTPQYYPFKQSDMRTTPNAGNLPKRSLEKAQLLISPSPPCASLSFAKVWSTSSCRTCCAHGKLSQTSLPRAAVNFVPALQGVLAEWVHVAQGMRQPKTQCHMRCPCGTVKAARFPRRVTHQQHQGCMQKEIALV